MRHKKFDREWESACSLLSEEAATELRESILRLQYQQEITDCFTYPEAKALFTVIRPTIEKRALAAAKARARRQLLRQAKTMESKSGKHESADTGLSPEKIPSDSDSMKTTGSDMTEADRQRSQAIRSDKKRRHNKFYKHKMRKNKAAPINMSMNHMPPKVI